MKEKIRAIHDLLVRELALFYSIKSFADGIKIIVRVGIILFFVAFKWVIPLTIFSIIRHFSH